MFVISNLFHFIQYYIKKHPAVNPKEAKTKYDSLAHGKKLKYITKSIKEYKSAHRESEEVTCKIRKNEFEIYFRCVTIHSFMDRIHLKFKKVQIFLKLHTIFWLCYIYVTNLLFFPF